IGKSIHYNNIGHHNIEEGEDFKITAVFDIPVNASQKFDFVLNWYHQLKAVDWLKDWINRGPNTFIQLQDGADASKVQAKIKDFISPYIAAANYGSSNRTELGLQ